MISSCLTLPNLREVILMGFYPESDFNHFLETIRAKQTPPSSSSSCSKSVVFKYLQEPENMGNAGGLYHFAEEIQKGMDKTAGSTLFVLHGDVLCNFPLCELHKFHLSHKQEASILAKQKLGATATQLSHFGCLVADPSTHIVEHFAEKPSSFVSDLVNCGVYAFSPSLFTRLAKIAASLRADHAADTNSLNRRLFLSSSSGRADLVRITLEKDVLTDLVKESALALYQTQGWWLQIKKPADVLHCTPFVLQDIGSQQDNKVDSTNSVIVHQSATVHPSAKLGPNVTIGKDVVIASGVRLKDSVLLDGCTVQDNACIMSSILGWQTTIGQWARLEADSQQQISILGNDVKVPPEILVRGGVVLPHKELKENVISSIVL